MLNNSKVMSFVATTDAVKARDYYENVLGLKFIEDHEYALVFDLNGISLRIQKVQQLTPAMFTSLGWEVENIEKEIKHLVKKGVIFERYPYFEQDKLGIWTVAGGAKIAWFKDPDGNTLSLTQNP